MGAAFDRTNALFTEGKKFAAHVEAERQGRFQSGLDLVPLSTLQAEFSGRQHFLAQTPGPEAFNPQYLSGRLEGAERHREGAKNDRDTALEKGDRGEWAAASKRFADADLAANKFKQSLEHLSDVSSQAAVIREKLNRIEADKEGRLGFAKRFAVASGEERSEMTRGVVLAQHVFAKSGGDARGLSEADRRLVFSTVDSFGGAQVPAFGNRTGPEISRMMLEKSYPEIANVTGQKQGEKDSLTGELQKVYDRANEANNLLVEGMKSNFASFIGDLDKSMNSFFLELNRGELQRKATESETAAGLAGKKAEELGGYAHSAQIFGKLNITEAERKALLGQEGAYGKFAEADKQYQEAKRQDPSQVGRDIASRFLDDIAATHPEKTYIQTEEQKTAISNAKRDAKTRINTLPYDQDTKDSLIKKLEGLTVKYNGSQDGTNAYLPQNWFGAAEWAKKQLVGGNFNGDWVMVQKHREDILREFGGGVQEAGGNEVSRLQIEREKYDKEVKNISSAKLASLAEAERQGQFPDGGVSGAARRFEKPS